MAEFELKKSNIHGNTFMSSNVNTYINQYLTFEILNTGVFSVFLPNESTVYFTKNGSDWTLMSENVNNELNVQQGDILQFKCALVKTETFPFAIYGSNTTSEFNAYGNILSVVYGDDFENKSDILELVTDIGYSPFEEMFIECPIKDASNLCLPDVQLMEGEYRNMFAHSEISKAPTIIPAYLNECCYYGMFDDCKYLRGDIVIPEPLGIVSGVNIHNTGDTPYINMFTNEYASGDIDSNALTIEVKALLCELIDIKELENMTNSDSTLTLNIVLPWNGYDNKVEGAFKAIPEYFQDELRYYDDVNNTFISKFKFSPDKFCSILKISNEIKLKRNIIAGQYNENNIDILNVKINLIEPLKYFAEMPLTFDVIDACEITWMNGVTGSDWGFFTEDLEYSINDGPWQKYYRGIVVPSNTKIAWRSSVDKTADDYDSRLKSSINLQTRSSLDNDNTAVKRMNTGKFNAYGNIMSLLAPNFSTIDSIPWKECFKKCFFGTRIKNARDLVLPAIYLLNECYMQMFMMSSIQIPPAVLPVKNLRYREEFGDAGHCYSIYEDMFNGCEELITAPRIMMASFFDMNTKSPHYDSSWDFVCKCGKDQLGDGQTTDYTPPAKVFKNMFSECISLMNVPDIRLSYYMIQNAAINEVFAGMFKGCINLKTIYIHTHNPKPGYIGNSILYDENGMFGGHSSYNSEDWTCDVYAYTEYDNYKDFYLNAMLDENSRVHVNIINMHKVLPPEEPEDNTKYFYIEVIDSTHSSTIDTLTFERPTNFIDYTWNSFYWDVKSLITGEGGLTIRGKKYKVLRGCFVMELSGGRTTRDNFKYLAVPNLYGSANTKDNCGIFRSSKQRNSYSMVWLSDNILPGKTYYITSGMGNNIALDV